MRLERLQLCRRTRRADDPRAEVFAERQRGDPDPGRRRRHQQRLAPLQPATREQRVVDDDKDDRDACRLLERQRVGDRHQFARVDEREFGKPAVAPAHRPLAGLEPGDAGAELGNLAGRIAAAGALLGGRLVGPGREIMQAAKFGAVDRRRTDAEQHMARRHDRPLHIADVPASAGGAGNHHRRLHVAPLRCWLYDRRGRCPEASDVSRRCRSAIRLPAAPAAA